MKHALIAALATTALAGCSTNPAPIVVSEAVETIEVPAPAAAPKPQLGTFGFDTAGMDSTVLPGNDFYQYSNGTWAKNTAIPADKSNYGMFTQLDDLSKERTRTIIEEAAKDPSSKVGIAYSAFLDQAAIDTKGLAPMRGWMDRIAATKGKSDLPQLYAAADKMGIATPFLVYIGQDDKNPDRYIAAMYQGGIGLPDRDYYLSKDAKFADIRAKYLAHLTNMLTLAGEPGAEARAKALLAFETKVAKVHWDKVDSSDSDKTYNLLPVAKLQKMAPGYAFAQQLSAMKIGVDEINVNQPSAVTGIAALIAKAPLQVLKDQLLVQSLKTYAPVLPTAIDQEVFAFDGTVLNGTPEQEARWKRGVGFVSGALADDVSKQYVARFFPPETKAAADQLVKNVIAAMDRRIQGLTWMAPETKVRARAKLGNFTAKIGYPDQWHDYSALAVEPGDAFGNAVRAAAWANDDAVSKLGGPIRRWEWGMTPMTVNAYANFNMQEIVFPASILQPPFFDPNADPALNYGGIGAVIGHEISHHFDDQGSKYDENGRLNAWWTEADKKAFEAAGKALIAQYDAYEIFPGVHLNGEFTLGENIGDLAGLTVAYDAYHHSLGGRPAPVLDGTTGDQRFYLGWAQVWRRNYREANLRQRVVTDPHSPSIQRTWVVRNLDPWYGAFDVTADQTLYLDPAKRVRMW